MKNPERKTHKTGRRGFISMLSAVAATGLIGAKGAGFESSGEKTDISIQQAAMPTIALGPHRISRLICGSNQFLGYSYMGPHVDQHMKEYFNTQRAADLLTTCERAGITAHQCSSRLDYFPTLRERGSKLKIISLHSGNDKVREAIEAANPIALVHHGGDTDRAFAAGKKQVVRDFVKSVKDRGLLAGVSAHNPDVVKQIADEGWEVDFFMTCFYFLTRPKDKINPEQVLPAGTYNFYRDDPKRMTEVIRQVKQPCLGFKILGAGRMCANQKTVRAAFQFAFENIKPSDGVIVGMFPWMLDEVGANTQYTRELAV
jgi:hypothetical protein